MEVVDYILEDSTADLLNSTFTDIEKRLVLRLMPTNTDRTTVLVLNGHQSTRSDVVPQWELQMLFNPGGGLGVVHFSGSRPAMAMENYLVKVNAASLNRWFTAGDGRRYVWYFRRNPQQPDEEWSCFDQAGAQVAGYFLPLPTEHYKNTSGCTFTVIPAAYTLASELLMSLTIMRFIQKHNL
ncbi:hypothetical protein BKA62DRAFT_621508 [Auriculariales sp. MPI-PUGE-AT-0066]|nr:hypothetical protein BKA62DRAFT_621508 [Auriculariales sp. MPI-PUGE-AT-0066]